MTSFDAETDLKPIIIIIIIRKSFQDTPRKSVEVFVQVDVVAVERVM